MTPPTITTKELPNTPQLLYNTDKIYLNKIGKEYFNNTCSGMPLMGRRLGNDKGIPLFLVILEKVKLKSVNQSGGFDRLLSFSAAEQVRKPRVT